MTTTSFIGSPHLLQQSCSRAVKTEPSRRFTSTRMFVYFQTMSLCQESNVSPSKGFVCHVARKSKCWRYFNTACCPSSIPRRRRHDKALGSAKRQVGLPISQGSALI